MPWTLAELKKLGKAPDSVLARRFRRTIKEVVAERKHRRIRLATVTGQFKTSHSWALQNRPV
jgi:hypothetical protein